MKELQNSPEMKQIQMVKKQWERELQAEEGDSSYDEQEDDSQDDVDAFDQEDMDMKDEEYKSHI